MATTQNTFNGTGANLGPFSFTFQWLEDTDIKVSVDGVLKTAGTHYNLQTLNYTTKTGGQVLFTAGNAPPVGTGNIRIFRNTDNDNLNSTFSPGSAIRAKDLNDNFTQQLYVSQEVDNNAVNIDGSNPMVGNLNLNNFKITNLGTPTNLGDSASKSYVDSFAFNQSGIGVGDKGDLTVSNNGNTWTIDNGAINDAKVASNAAITSGKLAFTQAGTGAVQRTVEAKLQDVVSVKDFGAVGDNSANDTAAMQAFLNAGGGHIPPGTYLVDGLTISNQVYVECSKNAILKRRTNTNRITIDFANGSSGSFWSGGTIDANTTLNTGWTYLGISNDRQAMFVNDDKITLKDLIFINWPNHPLVAPGDYLTASNLTFRNCATGPLFGWEGVTSNQSRQAKRSGIGQSVDGILLQSCGNLSGVSGTLQHGFDTYGCKDSTYRNISMVGMDSPASGISYAISGHTDKLSEGCTFQAIIFASPISEDHQHLAFSYLGSKNCSFSNFTATYFAGLGLETLSCYGCSFTNILVDQQYRSTTNTPIASSKGLSSDKGRYNPEGNLSRDIHGAKENIYTACLFRRCGLGMDIKTGQSIFNGCTVLGSVNTGISVDQSAGTATFPGAAQAPATDVQFIACKSRWNGAQGINVAVAGTVVIIGGDYSNNGQNTGFAATTRSGVTASIADRLSLTNLILSDSQSFTITNGASFAPGTTTNNRYTFCLITPAALSEGQYVTLANGGGAGIDRTGKIVDIDSEDITIEFDVSTTFSSTGNTIALTGTWSGSGTTLTGSGGAATTEITVPTFVTDGTSWRKVIRVVDSNSIRIESAFPTSLSGATLNKLAVNLTGVPSQQYGARIFGSVAKLFIKGVSAFGNVLEKTTISNLSTLEPGSEYWRKSTTTANAATIDLQTSVYQGHRLTGWALWNSLAITGGGATSFDIRRTDSSGTLKETLATGLSLSLNQKPRGNAAGGITVTNDKVVVAFNGGTPTAGTIVGEFYYHVELPEVL